MRDQYRPRDKSLIDQAKDAIDDFFGGDAEEAAERTPALVGARMSMDQEERRDIGMDVPGVETPPYSGSAGDQALELAERELPGSRSHKKSPDPTDTGLAPF